MTSFTSMFLFWVAKNAVEFFIAIFALVATVAFIAFLEWEGNRKR